MSVNRFLRQRTLYSGWKSNLNSCYTRQFSVSAIAFSNDEPPIMAIVRQRLKDAMRSGNVPAKDATRSVIAAVKNSNIEKPGSINSDIKFHSLVASLISKREKAMAEYKEGNRQDLVDKEQGIIDQLSAILNEVTVASSEDVDKKVAELVKTLDVDFTDKAVMGKIMSKVPWKEVEAEWRASQKQVAESIKRILSSGQQTRSFSTSVRRMGHDNPLVRN